MKIFRRTLSLLLAAVMLLTVLPLTGAKFEASAKEVVPGSFEAVLNYLRKNGKKDKSVSGGLYVVDYEMELERTTGSSGFTLVELVYVERTDSIQLYYQKGDYSGLLEIMSGVNRILEPDSASAAIHKGIDYAVRNGDITVMATFDPKNFQKDNIQYVEFESANNKVSQADVKELLDTYAWESFSYLNTYLLEHLGFGLANFGFTAFGEPIPLKETKVQSVKMSGFDINYNDFVIITPDITADGYSYTVKYESSKPGIVSIDDLGSIVPLGPGKAVVTCTVTDSFGNVTTESCEVKISFTFGQWLIWIFLLGFLWY